MHNYILLGNEIKAVDPLEWAKWFEKANRTIDYTELENGYGVSTVFLSIEHGRDEQGRPILFETMVFSKDADYEKDCVRYATRADALTGHCRMVQKWAKGEPEDDD